MRRILFTCCFLWVALLGLSAQTSDQGYLKFKGIPIDGPLDEFVQKLKQKGYKANPKFSGVEGFLTGSFWNISDCNIFVSAADNQVLGVIVFFPTQDTWSDLKNRYDALKRDLTQKYGEPSSDSSKLLKSQLEDPNWTSTFQLEEGFIVISIANNTFVVISYITNNLLAAKAAEDL